MKNIKKIKNSQKLKVNNRTFFIADDEQSEVYNQIKNELIRKYNISTSNRDVIIKSLISHITQGDYINNSIPKIDLMILRTDIKNFFPSINKHKLYQKLNNSNILSHSTIHILKEALFSNKVEGVPLGLQFSSHLAELYLEDFDAEIKKTFQPIVYFRYVDDIIIINYDFTKNKQEQTKIQTEMLSNIDNIFTKYSLKRNLKKTEFSSYKKGNLSSDLKFDYLGYQFKSNDSQLIIGIAQEKIVKVEKKIKSYFFNFKKGSRSNKEFWTLYYKLKNTIHGVTSYDKRGKQFKFGLGYHYRFVTEETCILKIINIIKSLIYSCNLSAYKTGTLLSIINYDLTSGKPTDLLNKRFNYLKLTTFQKELITKRLNVPWLSTSSTFSKRLFFILYS
ncbi:hypothetical protein CQZ91_18895 [Bacillus cereus]|uniref:RNA-directed DNA polymerase n=2 Tax=Bacillaceae TaxID=186817 RepID=UPI00087228F7|nr:MULTISPECIES: RNA-directed DNA polymerase [Bacillus]MCC0760279.1 RNA-directed DNA polymerase [Bacillus sp. BRTN]MCC0771411.1 RNA-directed DNA polymerase [Bacillus pacificus]MDA1846972.1 RNA-directed DNA polymerase [Bacillus cereus]MDA2512592.1 RNA-directed DNA polymerase [Bacillus cereus]MDC2944036.1 RNA-directed DNA polymerase [Bacillus thuringiensis]